MDLYKTSFLSFISTSVKMISLLAINKIVSIFIGPSGLAVFGQFQNFVNIAMTVGQGAINQGVVKLTSESSKEALVLPKIFSTALKVSLMCSFITCLLVIIFSKQLSNLILYDESFSYVFVTLGFTLVLFVINNLLLSILNGLKEISLWIKINIIQSLISLFFTSLLVFFLRLDGALLALATNQSIVFIILVIILRKANLLDIKSFTKKIDIGVLKKLSGFIFYAAITAIAIPLSQIFVRDQISTSLSIIDAGIWQGMLYISLAYLTLITTTLSVYYLPRLSEIKNKKNFVEEINNGYLIIMPSLFAFSVLIYLFRDQIILLLFNESFLPMRDLFLWQLMGDYLKIACFLIGYALIAKSKTLIMGFKTIFLSSCYVIFSCYFLQHFGLVGVTYAYICQYILNLIILICLYNNLLRNL